MMFLSRLILNPRSPHVRRDLGNCQELHRTILSAFPQTNLGATGARSQFGILYRVESRSDITGAITLLVQSTDEPDWSKLAEGYLRDTSGNPPNPAYKSITERYQALQPGMTLAFRVRANPTRRVSDKSTKDDQKWFGKRIELRREEDQVEWLQRKAELSGFKILSVRVNPGVPNLRISTEGKTLGRRARDKMETTEAKRPLTFGSVLFEGTLGIADINLFRKTLESGIGPGKAYGFGLLSLSRLSE